MTQLVESRPDERANASIVAKWWPRLNVVHLFFPSQGCIVEIMKWLSDLKILARTLEATIAGLEVLALIFSLVLYCAINSSDKYKAWIETCSASPSFKSILTPHIVTTKCSSRCNNLISVPIRIGSEVYSSVSPACTVREFWATHYDPTQGRKWQSFLFFFLSAFFTRL